jgi:hypothetical protein
MKLHRWLESHHIILQFSTKATGEEICLLGYYAMQSKLLNIFMSSLPREE